MDEKKPRHGRGFLFLPRLDLFHVLRQKLRRALPGKIAGVLAVAGTLVAIEAMRRIGVGVDLGLRLFFLDVLDGRHWNAVILLAEMHLYRALRLFVGELADHAAVERDRSEERRVGKECRSRWSP